MEIGPMKRAFVFAVLAGLALPAGAALAQGGPPMGGAPGPQGQAQSPAPQIAGGQQAIAGNPAGPQGGNAGIFGNPSQPQAGGPAGGAAIAQSTTTTTGAVATQTTTVASEDLVFVQHHWMVNRVIQHAVTRNFEEKFGGHPLFAPTVGFAPVGMFPVPSFGDLELLNIGMVSDAAPDHGPIYRVSIKNNSPLPVFGVRVSLIAVLGELQRSSPVVTTDIREIAAGGIASLDVQMPVAVMTLGPEGKAAAFETLVAAIDSFNELPETNELNNVATLIRSEIDVIETAVQGATTTTTTVAAPAAGAAAPAVAAPAGAPADAGAPPMEGAAAPMGPAPGASPQDSALENLNLDAVENASASYDR
jgi:hypothetical protein